MQKYAEFDSLMVVLLLKKDLFREQQPVLPSASQEIYITKPLTHSIKEENEIFNTLVSC